MPMIDFSRDHFSLFDLPRQYRIDPTALDRRYRALQADVHPDRHAWASDAGRRIALQASARVNEAYAALRDPASRGEYLLGLLGIASLAETDTAMPADFLMEQMERREAIGDAAAAGDHAALEQALLEIAAERDDLDRQLAEAIDIKHALAEAKSAVRKLRFLDRVKAEITDQLIAIEA